MPVSRILRNMLLFTASTAIVLFIIPGCAETSRDRDISEITKQNQQVRSVQMPPQAKALKKRPLDEPLDQQGTQAQAKSKPAPASAETFEQPQQAKSAPASASLVQESNDVKTAVQPVNEFDIKPNMSVDGKIKVLLVHDFYDPFGRVSFDTLALNEFVPVEDMVADDIDVVRTRPMFAGQYINKLSDFHVIILWDVPYVSTIGYDKAGTQTKKVTEIPGDFINAVKSFVFNGGGLVIFGGTERVFTEGTSISSPAGSYIVYEGYFGSPLEQLLPLEYYPDGIGVKEDSQDVHTGRLSRAFRRHPDKPVTGGMMFGSGRVFAATWDDRRRGLTWTFEAPVWNNAIYWAAKRQYDYVDSRERSQLIDNYYESLRVESKSPPANWVQRSFPFMLLTDIENITPLKTAYFRAVGFNRISFWGGWKFPEGIEAADEAAAQGLGVYPYIGVLQPLLLQSYLQRQYPEEPSRWKPTYHDGSFVQSPYSVTPFATTVRSLSSQLLTEMVQEYSENTDHSDYLLGYLLDNEQTSSMDYDFKRGMVATHDDYADNHFKQLTSRPVPNPEYFGTGYIAPDGDIWLKWVKEIRIKGWTDYCSEVTAGLKDASPDSQFGYLFGAFWGGADFFVDQYYQKLHNQNVLTTSLRADVAFARFNDLEGEITPYWAEILLSGVTGSEEFSGAEALTPEQLDLTVGLAISRGLKGLILWNPGRMWKEPASSPGMLESKVMQIGDFLKTHGPMLEKLRRKQCDVWYLGSWVNPNSFDHYHFIAALGNGPEKDDPIWPWYRMHVDDVAWPALLRANVPVTGVIEAQLMSDELFTKKAVIIPALQYCRQEVTDNLEQFILAGGKVYTDRSTKVKIEGAQVLPLDFDLWHKKILSQNLPDVVTSGDPVDEFSDRQREQIISDFVPVLENSITNSLTADVKTVSEGSRLNYALHSVLQNGTVDYLFVLNSDFSSPQRVVVTLASDPGIVVDMKQTKEVDVEKAQDKWRFTAELQAGGWKLYMLNKKRISGVDIFNCSVINNSLYTGVVTLDSNKSIYTGAVPLKVDIQGEDSTVTFYTTTDKGIADIELPLEDYVSGLVKVTVTELVNNHSESFDLSEKK